MQNWQVVVLGLIEGLTEFIPVSSTGHLLLVGHFMGFKSPGRTFEVLIQLGAILAILSVYFGKLMRLLLDLPRDPRVRRFRAGRAIGFLAGGNHRRNSAQIHQGCFVRIALAGVHDSDHRRDHSFRCR